MEQNTAYIWPVLDVEIKETKLSEFKCLWTTLNGISKSIYAS